MATVHGVTRGELDDAAAHFSEHGWVVVDAVPPDARAALARWADEVAALPETTGVLQHREATDHGAQLCRSENFLPAHAELRALLCTGPLLDVAGRLLGEPAVLYKEKINYKLPGGAGYSAHQDAPAYPMIAAHVSAMIAIDGADESNGGLEIVSNRFDAALPTDSRGCIEPAVAESLDWMPVAVPAGSTLWFHSRTPHRSRANRSAHPRRALYPTYNAASEGDRRAEYYAHKQAAFARTDPGDRALVSLIGDFEGRPA
jgi:ectoine hydroxylase-related dioxygenase (phytanoyl-CoA dioxygenase family)